jgi:hypothetical protein
MGIVANNAPGTGLSFALPGPDAKPVATATRRRFGKERGSKRDSHGPATVGASRAIDDAERLLVQLQGDSVHLLEGALLQAPQELVVVLVVLPASSGLSASIS